MPRNIVTELRERAARDVRLALDLRLPPAVIRRRYERWSRLRDAEQAEQQQQKEAA